MEPDDFFYDLDVLLSQENDAGTIHLRIIGSGALMLQTGYRRGTKDSDVLETPSLDARTQALLLRLAGQQTPLYRRHRMYLDIVKHGIPFLPRTPLWHPLQINTVLSCLHLEALDITDVAVSKLKRFVGSDRNDIAAMVRLGLIDHRRFVERFRDAAEGYRLDARWDDVPTYAENLHTIERDCFLLDEETDFSDLL